MSVILIRKRRIVKTNFQLRLVTRLKVYVNSPFFKKKMIKFIEDALN